MQTTIDKASRNRNYVRSRRTALREAGLRPVQIWVPDLRNEEQLKEVQRELAVLYNDPHEQEYNDLAEAAAMENEGWESCEEETL